MRFLLVLRAGANQLQTNAHSGAIFSSSESQLHGGAGLGICLIFGLSTPDAGGINPNGEIRCLRSVIGFEFGVVWCVYYNDCIIIRPIFYVFICGFVLDRDFLVFDFLILDLLLDFLDLAPPLSRLRFLLLTEPESEGLMETEPG